MPTKFIEGDLTSTSLNSNNKDNNSNSSFKLVTVDLKLHLPAKYGRKIFQGITEHLNGLLLKYSKELGGIILTYRSVKLLDNRTVLLDESPLIHVPLRATFLLFAPLLFQRLDGVINHCSGEHVGLLVYGLFNAAIPAEALKSHYYWDVNQLLWTPKVAKKSKKVQNIEKIEKVKKVELADDHDVVSAPLQPLQLELRLAFKITSIDCIQDTVGFQGSLLD